MLPLWIINRKSHQTENILQIIDSSETLKIKIKDSGGTADYPDGAATFIPGVDQDERVQQGESVGIKTYPADNPDILSLKHTVLCGIKGVSAYADHAYILGKTDDSVFEYVHRALASILRTDLSLEDWLSLSLECGQTALKTMELLDAFFIYQAITLNLLLTEHLPCLVSLKIRSQVKPPLALPETVC